MIVAAALGAAEAAECGPDKLGTSRVLPLGAQGIDVGLKTYPRTLALADHEVILTFDDGPARGATRAILDALAAQCVRATFFLIGRNAEALPHLVQQEQREGHTIGHHSFSHPGATLRGLSDAAARADILRGMAADQRAANGEPASASVPASLAELRLRTPFFRFPGFADTPALLAWLNAGNVNVFGADLWASDWIAMSPQQELALTLARLEKARRGIILFHDTHQWTADMMPAFLRALKMRGYRVVHIVAGVGSAQTMPAPQGWSSETERIIDGLKRQSVAPTL
jgi:peptidoglycan/xylan/chitin deacetylase (PgdA/CDA1 family)